MKELIEVEPVAQARSVLMMIRTKEQTESPVNMIMAAQLHAAIDIR